MSLLDFLIDYGSSLHFNVILELLFLVIESNALVYGIFI